jgi:hypothetical protein
VFATAAGSTCTRRTTTTRSSSNLEADPDERTNLLLHGEPPAEILAVRERLRSTLTEWVRTARAGSSDLNPADFEESMKRLKALGYHGDDQESPPDSPDDS